MKDYWGMSDDDLKKLAERYNIECDEEVTKEPAFFGTSEVMKIRWPRDKVIKQLVERDQAFSAKGARISMWVSIAMAAVTTAVAVIHLILTLP